MIVSCVHCFICLNLFVQLNFCSLVQIIDLIQLANANANGHTASALDEDELAVLGDLQKRRREITEKRAKVNERQVRG
jgi:hypothetical protein